MYEYVDLMLIFINLLFCGFLLAKHNRMVQNQVKLENLILSSIKNPKLGKKLANSYKIIEK